MILFFGFLFLGSIILSGVASAAVTPINVKPINNTKLNVTASASPSAGVYHNTILVKLKMDKNGVIYYTLNGTIPTTKSTKYTKPFYLFTSKTLKFVAIDTNGNKSIVYTKKYIINDTTKPKALSFNVLNKNMHGILYKVITIKYSEPIKAGTAFNKIIVKNGKGKLISISSKYISGNVLTISLRTSGDPHVYLPKYSIVDMNNNWGDPHDAP